MRTFRVLASLAALAVVLACAAPPSEAALIRIINTDGPGEGFNDPTPVAPVGGNSGTTLGAQRLVVFQTAADSWGRLLASPVEIRVEASFDALPCDLNSGILGAGSAISLFTNFDNAPFTSTWYPSSLAARFAGRDLEESANDILVRFNSSLDGPSCLGTVSWYYGLDGVEGNDSDLLSVVLHELAHGLGFNCYVDLDTGELLNGLPDIYSRFVLDTSNGLHWSQMTNPQRLASSERSGEVVWDGAAVTGHADEFLTYPGIVRVDAPPAISGELLFEGATFGPPLTSPGVNADVVEAVPFDACAPLTNALALAGKIALIQRGTCEFTQKVAAAEAAGAIAVLVVNNNGNAPIFMTGDAPGITIPSVMLWQSDGNAIRAQIGAGAHVTLTDDESLPRSGTIAGDRLLLYAPNPSEAGASIVHWDVSATPNLLMEPFDGAGVNGGLDLTPYALEDIGWFASVPLIQPITLSVAIPNPFRAFAGLRFEVAVPGNLDVSVYDLTGRLVKNLFNGPKGTGIGTVYWNGTDDDAHDLSSGVYLCRFRMNGFTDTRKLVLVR